MLAPRQSGVVSRGQLLAAGLDRNEVQRGLDSGRLHRVHHGVYSLLPLTALAPTARFHAALLACGDRAVLSHHTAAYLLELTEHPSFVAEVHVSTTADRRHPGLTVHRTRHLERADATKVGRLWTTSIPRTVKDLAHTLNDRAFERLTGEALKHVSAQKLGHIPRARELLDQPSTLTWSEAEERLLILVRRGGLPQPESNVPIGGFVPDLLWRAQRVIVEYDGRRDGHDSRPPRSRSSPIVNAATRSRPPATASCTSRTRCSETGPS